MSHNITFATFHLKNTENQSFFHFFYFPFMYLTYVPSSVHADFFRFDPSLLQVHLAVFPTSRGGDF